MNVIVLRGTKIYEIDETRREQLEKTNLFLNGRLRWNILLNLIVIFFILIPFFIRIEFLFALNGYFLIFLVIFASISTIRQFKLNRTIKKFNSIQEVKTNIKNVSIMLPMSEKVSSVNKFSFVMVTFVYKETLELIYKSLNNISTLNGAQDLILTVCLEEKTPDLEFKISSISRDFGCKFSKLIITVHPYGVEGEIPGKCSNANYGIRSLYQYLKTENPNLDPNEYFITNFDIDTFFHKNFLDTLKLEALKEEKNLSNIVWQSYIYYNWNLDKLSFFTRIIGIVRSAHIAGALTPFNINIMSIYTATLKLYIDGNFTHPFYQMEDIICFIRWMMVTKTKLKIKPLYSPVVSGPTSGETMLVELKELIKQATRWSIGSAEVFHYFMVKKKRLGFTSAIVWFFNYVNYYACFLCAQTFLMITTTIRLLIFGSSFVSVNGIISDKRDLADVLLKVFYILIGVLYMINLWLFMMNKLAVKTFLKDLNVKENFGFFRDLLHVLLSVPTQLAYSFIVFYGFFKVVLYGKAECQHKPSNKDSLKI